MIDPKFARMLEDSNARQIKPMFDPANNKLYFQTDPYIENGEVCVTRLAEYPVTVKMAYQVIEEYELTAYYGKEEP